MPGYMHMSDGVNTPWQPYNDQIQTIAVAKGVTRYLSMRLKEWEN